MGLLGRGKSRVLLVAGLLLLFGLGTGQVSPGSALAQEDIGERPVRCWVSGDGTEDVSWGRRNFGGGEDYEYVVNAAGDVGQRAAGFPGGYRPSVVNEWWLRIPNTYTGASIERPPPHLVPFLSFPEAIDYSFVVTPRFGDRTTGAVDGPGAEFWAQMVPDDNASVDIRTKRLRELLGGELLQDGSLVVNPYDKSRQIDERVDRILPWFDVEEYTERRPVAVGSEDRVKVYRVAWKDAENPGGGLSTDFSSLMRDRTAEEADLVSGTTSMEQGGTHLHLGQGEAAAVQLQSNRTQDCTGLSCSETYTLTGTPTTVAVSSLVVESNNGMYSGNELGGSNRYILDENGNEVLLERNLASVGGSGLADRSGKSAGYGQRFQSDTGTDELYITLELEPAYRQDFMWDSRGVGTIPMRAFGPEGSLIAYKGYGEGRIRGWAETLSGDGGVGALSLGHSGYRQPMLSSFYQGRLEVPGEVAHIRWPVNIEDLNWFLYELPGEYRRGADTWWLAWLNKDAIGNLIRGEKGNSADLAGEDPDCSQDGAFLEKNFVECGNLPAGLYLSFDTDDTTPGANDGGLKHDMLLRQGVASPVDAGESGLRTLSTFQFEVKESAPMGRALESGGAGEVRYGVPNDPDYRKAYIDAWADRGFDPNRSYLMVVTYYEVALNPSGRDQGVVTYTAPGKDRIALPKRSIRRVVCRMLVSPSGFDPVIDEDAGFFAWATDNVVKGIGKGIKVAAGWLGGLLRGVIHFPGWGVKQGGALACGGLSKMDELTSSAARDARASQVDVDGVVVVNAATRSKKEGFEDCERVSAPVVPTCESSTDVIFQGRCVQLPRLKLGVERAEYLDLTEVVPYRRWERGFAGFGDYIHAPEDGKRGVPDIFYESVGVEPEDRNPKNVGLTRVTLDWEYLGGNESPGLDDQVRGQVVYVWPDPKSSDLPENGFYKFVLPEWINKFKAAADPHDEYYHYRVDGFTVGDLDHQAGFPVPPNPESCSNALVYLAGRGCGLSVNGSVYMQEQYKDFVLAVGALPLAPGFSHKFAVAPYVGEPGMPTYRQGPVSETVTLDGNNAACLTGLTGTIPVRVEEIYGCDAVAGRGNVEAGFRVGLLGLTGTSICYDIFSSTPPGFTWDNPVVKRVWALTWIIAGGVLFALLVWQGLKMTYDIWIEPQATFGFRELVPRFLLAVALAAGSLYIAQFVLVLASDITCFVAQTTGMTMWGMIGGTFGVLFDAFLGWHTAFLEDIESMHLSELLKGVFFALALTLVLAVFVLGILLLFLKVGLGMLMRIALLAVLIALAPLAFAFYASETTSHWTRKWVAMFLGATFQQVFVLIVVYIGGNLAGTYMAEGQESGMGEMVIGLLLAFLTLALADKVPSIINPSGQGLFQSMGQLGNMAIAGTVMAASVGIGAVSGPLAPAVPRAARAMGGMMGRMGQTSGTESSDGGGGEGGGPGGLGVRLGGGPGGGRGSGGGVGGGQALAGLAGTTFAGVGASAAAGASAGGGAVGGPAGGAPSGGSPEGGMPGGGIPGGGMPGGGEPGGGGGRSVAGMGGRLGRAAAWLPQQILQGARAGYRRGGGANTRLADVASGNFLYRHGSRGDDAAMVMERQGRDTRESYDRMSDVMEKLNERMGG